mgnify:CR=1 FL=1
MAAPSGTAAGPHSPRSTAQSTPRDTRRVAVATLIGTTVEWYDFFIYATAAGLVFSELFFKPAGSEFATLVTFATVGLSFLFRPLGAFLAGHYGDKLGRKAMLVLTLLLMGGATTLIGVLPTYATAGIWAPILLVLLRIIQGISAGGEWGGAVLMSVEHAPRNKRGLFGSFPQLGVPLGMLAARFRCVNDTLGMLGLGLQALPRVCWVPLACIWFGQTESALLFVVIMGTLWSVLLKHNPVSRIAVYMFLQPVFGVMLSLILYPETQTPLLRYGAALVLVCLSIVVVGKGQHKD